MQGPSICSPSILTCPGGDSLPGGRLRPSSCRARASLGSKRPHSVPGPKVRPAPPTAQISQTPSTLAQTLSTPSQEGCTQGLSSDPHCVQIEKLRPKKGEGTKRISGRPLCLPLQCFFNTSRNLVTPQVPLAPWPTCYPPLTLPLS